jgi:hypothetical protein
VSARMTMKVETRMRHADEGARVVVLSGFQAS